MSEQKVWAASDDGCIEYISLTKDLVQPVMKVMHQYFYQSETISVAFDMPNQPESFPEMDVLLLNAAKDGVSIVARDKATGQVAGVTLNKLEDPSISTSFYTDNYKSLKSSAVKGIAQWIIDVENSFDVFEYCKVDSLLEIMFLTTVPEFRKRGVAKKLVEVSVNLAKKLKRGEKVRVSIDDEPVKFGIPPQIVTVICTSSITQKIVKDLGFKTGSKMDLSKFSYGGRSLADMTGNKIMCFTYDYIEV